MTLREMHELVERWIADGYSDAEVVLPGNEETTLVDGRRQIRGMSPIVDIERREAIWTGSHFETRGVRTKGRVTVMSLVLRFVGSNRRAQ